MNTKPTFSTSGRRHFLLAGIGSAKYFMLGSFATAFFLYGVALIYGAAGTTSLLGIRKAGAASLKSSG